ncbi:DNA polymerase subunit gamma-2, mitochondrial [Anthonomus grandis grandis]|uniref:DNA polymerase subunit gamma-2, mitochondrial n=1 Tax=Anthonomus grandis grandis TaxID=2921223 RepID=UPI0021665CA2|nr:DNA polymerase subunit gamma-2, mitochondrial [Anthonomus grandis grandis]
MSVNIEAKLPWTTELVETIVMQPKPLRDIGEEKFSDGKKRIQPHSIISTINLTTMFMTTICDAYDESEYKGNSRTLLRFHRKLAPYRISFAIVSSGVSANVLSELNDLALYLTKQLRLNHVSTLFSASSSKLSLEAQWRLYDEMGIPYNILLNEKTLKDGLAFLRSRDTTLKEQVHVTELVGYVDQLFRNY